MNDPWHWNIRVTLGHLDPWGREPVKGAAPPLRVPQPDTTGRMKELSKTPELKGNTLQHTSSRAKAKYKRETRFGTSQMKSGLLETLPSHTCTAMSPNGGAPLKHHASNQTPQSSWNDTLGAITGKIAKIFFLLSLPIPTLTVEPRKARLYLDSSLYTSGDTVLVSRNI